MKLPLLCAALLGSAAALATGDDPPPWEAILGPTRAEWPEPLAELDWRSDLGAAVEEARASGRPIFVTLRCLPCEQCSAFDRDVLEGGPVLGELLRQFVTVRLVTMRDVDRRLLPYDGFQDLDLSWWGYFLDGESLIGIYGGRDEVSDATRISVRSLANTLARVLDFHYDPRRAAWDVVPGTRAVDAVDWSVADESPGWDSWAERGAVEVDPTECLHCHQTAEVLVQDEIDAGRFDKRTDFWSWPFPENTGIVLDRDDGLLVTAVAPGSPAAAIGLEPGDRLGAAGGLLLFGQADFRGVLHRSSRAAEPARVGVVWTRGGEVYEGTLDLPAAWRETDLGWRKSVAEAAVGAHPGFPWPLGVDARERRRRGIAMDALAVRPYYPKGPRGVAGDAGLRGHHVIAAVNGERPDVEARAFMVWFRLRFEPGDAIALTVLEEDGAEREIAYTAPGSHE